MMSNFYQGKTFDEVCNQEKEHIKHALNGELPIPTDDGNFIYATADKKDCDEFILEAYDEVVFHAISSNLTGKAMDEVAQTNGLDFQQHFQEIQEKIDNEFGNSKYKFECVAEVVDD